MANAFSIGLLIVVAGACSSTGAPTGGAASGLRTLGGPVVDYPYAGTATVQAFAPEDPTVQLVAGTLTTSPAPRLQADLTALGQVPATAFVDPFFCAGATATPSDLRTTGAILLGVADSTGVFGAVLRASLATPAAGLRPGDRTFALLLASTAGRVTGSCALDGVLTRYDVELAPGWTHVAIRIDAVDAFGNAIATTLQNATPSASTPWYYLDFGTTLGLDPTTPAVLAARDAARAAFGDRP